MSRTHHEVFLLLDGLETSMTELGSGVNELEFDLLLSTAAGLDQKRFAQGQNPLLGSDHTAFQHEEVVGHLTIVHKPTLRKQESV